MQRCRARRENFDRLLLHQPDGKKKYIYNFQSDPKKEFLHIRKVRMVMPTASASFATRRFGMVETLYNHVSRRDGTTTHCELQLQQCLTKHCMWMSRFKYFICAKLAGFHIYPAGDVLCILIEPGKVVP